MSTDAAAPPDHGRTAADDALPGPRAAEVIRRDRRVTSPSYTRPYPLVIDRGRGVWVWDVDDNRFLDMTAGIAVTATGHSHPRVVAAVQQQAERFIHMSGTDFYYRLQPALGERLAAVAPGDDAWRVFFGNSGTEAVEAALKLARFVTRRPRLLAFQGAFHGRTMGALSLTASKAVQREGFAPLLGGVTHMPFPDPYRPPLGAGAEDVGQAVLDYIEHEVFARYVPPREVAAVFVEPLQGEGGYIHPPADFLPGLRALCDRHGILLVADEVQTGVGRTGRWWAVEHADVVPDMLTVAKGIASGMPLGAMVARAELMTWPPGAHASTFGGNPLAAAAALATLDVIEEDGLLENARRQGQRFVAGLLELARDDERLDNVRGLGLWVAVDLVKDRASRAPDPALRARLIERAFDHRLLLLGAGAGAVRFMAPLTVADEEVDEALSRFGAALAEA